MASLADVFVRVRPDTKGFGPELSRGVGKAGDDAGQTAGKGFTSGWGKGIKGVAAATAGAFGILKVTQFAASTIADSLTEARESVKVGKLTEQVIKTTGGAARVSAKDIESLATAISNKTGIDDEAIQSGENLLLTFTNIRNEVGKGNDIFSQATGIVQDMSVALGQDTKSSAIQLGKALNDPIKGISALQRVGVSFTEKQKDQIAALVKSGDTMGAQKIILRELGKEFGGAAEKAATPADKARVAWKNFEEEIGKKLLPLVDRLATWFATDGIAMLENFGKKVSATTQFIRDHWGAFKTLLIVLGALFVAQKVYSIGADLVTKATKAWAAMQWLMNAALSANPIGIVILAVGLLVAAIVIAWKKSETFRDVVKTVWSHIKNFFISGVQFVVNAFLTFVGAIITGAANAFGWVPGLGPKLKAAAKNFDKFKNDVNTSLEKLKDKDVKVTATFDAARSGKKDAAWIANFKAWQVKARGGPIEGGIPGKDSVPVLAMPGEFVIDAKGRNIGDALAFYGFRGMAAGGLVRRGLYLDQRFPAQTSMDRKASTQWVRTVGAVGEAGLTALGRSGIFDMLSGGAGVGSGVTRWSGLVLKALSLLHQSASWLGTVLRRMQRESGGNPYAINLWDINARNGDPSRGLMQTIGATFAAYANGYRSRGIYDPFANIFAALNYTLHRYGTLASLSRPGGYDAGGILQPGALGLNSTSRPERVLSPSQTALFERLVAGGTLGNSYTINIAPTPLAHPADIGKAVVQSIQEFERANGSRWRK